MTEREIDFATCLKDHEDEQNYGFLKEYYIGARKAKCTVIDLTSDTVWNKTLCERETRLE